MRMLIIWVGKPYIKLALVKIQIGFCYPKREPR